MINKYKKVDPSAIKVVTVQLARGKEIKDLCKLSKIILPRKPNGLELGRVPRDIELAVRLNDGQDYMQLRWMDGRLCKELVAIKMVTERYPEMVREFYGTESPE